MTDWGWRPRRTTGIWQHGARWSRPFIAAAPFLTVLVLLLMFYFVGGTMTTFKGVLFDLPEGGRTDGEPAELVALVMPLRHETVVFFDDSRYLLGDAASVRSLGEQIAERVSRSTSKTLLVLVDRRVRSGDVMGLATIARQGGVRRLLFAEKSQEASE